jgi:hypothetical protein
VRSTEELLKKLCTPLIETLPCAVPNGAGTVACARAVLLRDNSRDESGAILKVNGGGGPPPGLVTILSGGAETAKDRLTSSCGWSTRWYKTVREAEAEPVPVALASTVSGRPLTVRMTCADCVKEGSCIVKIVVPVSSVLATMGAAFVCVGLAIMHATTTVKGKPLLVFVVISTASYSGRFLLYDDGADCPL